MSIVLEHWDVDSLDGYIDRYCNVLDVLGYKLLREYVTAYSVLENDTHD